MFAERLEVIKGRKQFHTASYLRLIPSDKRIALKRQRYILGSFAYLCSFSRVPEPILCRRKSLLNTKLAFSGMRFHLKRTHESLRAAFHDKIALSRGEAEWDCRKTKDHIAKSREVGLDYENVRQIYSPHLTPRARFNVFVQQCNSLAICSVTFTCLPQQMLSKFRSKERSSFHLEKKLHRFSKEWKLCRYFSTVTAIFFFRVREPYIK